MFDETCARTATPIAMGLLGIDTLKGGFAIDFNTMRLELDQ